MAGELAGKPREVKLRDRPNGLDGHGPVARSQTRTVMKLLVEVE